MPSILGGVLLHGQDPAALGAAHSLLRILTSNDRYAAAMGSMQTLRYVLDELGFSGLWKDSSSAQPRTEEVKQECLELTAKLIEVRPTRWPSVEAQKLIETTSADCDVSSKGTSGASRRILLRST